MSFYIKVFSGKITNGQFTGVGEIYDNTNKYIRKGNFIKSKLNDPVGVVIDYEPPNIKLLQLVGNFVSDMANGAITQIEYDGADSLDVVLANNLTVPATKKNCTYINGVLSSIEAEFSININITYARHPTRGYFTNFIINEV